MRKIAYTDVLNRGAKEVVSPLDGILDGDKGGELDGTA